MSSWECPYCGRFSTHEAMESLKIGRAFNANSKYGNLYHGTLICICPNPECMEFTSLSYVTSAEMSGGRLQETGHVIELWNNRPQGVVKSFPEYVPKAVLEDYREAALICDLSPKAAATLSRRCLQGMIRDFWGVRERNLHAEIQAISDRIDPDTWQAIDAIRSIGNIGAHMEKDIDLIIDVQPGEAKLLIQLIETLIKDWYVHREERRRRAEAIVSMATDKKSQKNP